MDRSHSIIGISQYEHKRQVLDTLRQPLEDGKVCIARAADTVVFPARFQLVAAMNPCVCGYFGHPTRPCRCSATQIRRYTRKISGPLLDRFDLRVHVPPVERYARADAEGMKLLETAMRQFSLSARSYHRILKVARTIADLENVESIGSRQVAEALQYRGDEGHD